jgi:hypothetical protein
VINALSREHSLESAPLNTWGPLTQVKGPIPFFNRKNIFEDSNPNIATISRQSFTHKRNESSLSKRSRLGNASNNG